MLQHFEYYIDDEYQKSENSILYGKAIIVAMSRNHKQSWTKKQREVYFYHDTMTYAKIGKIYGITPQSVSKIYKRSVKKLEKIVKNLLRDRCCYNSVIG
jgi:DNA-directed RNA polymerase specialized sigma subunit